MGKIDIIKNRIYSDYIMPSRLDEYAKIVEESLSNGYIHLTIRDYNRLRENKGLDSNQKYFIHRHDIDTDVATAKAFFEIEKRYNIKATYYFRLSTLNFSFMREIESYGSEASYHFEEIAQYCKDNHIKSRDTVLQDIDKIRVKFKNNFKMIENRLGYKMVSVSSHGDFVNRKLEIINNEITKDKKLRRELGVECETYDDDLMKSFDIYVSDRPYPTFYTPKSIFEYIGKEFTICMLTHPRQWRTNIIVSSIDNLKRVYEGLKW